MKRGREEVKKGAWHLNMHHKGRWHVFGSVHALIGTGVRLQQSHNELT